MVKTCSQCGEAKTVSEFYLSQGKPRPQCKQCFNISSGKRVTLWRQRTKLRLIAAHGGMCVDCRIDGPSFIFEFDHRVPGEKSFEVSNATTTRSFDRILVESMKCDLVCANCHKIRTHLRQCEGCPHCDGTENLDSLRAIA